MVYVIGRFMFSIALLFVLVFQSCKHFDHLAWGRGSWSMCFSCNSLFILLALFVILFLLLLVSGVDSGFRMGTPWTFLLTVFLGISK